MATPACSRFSAGSIFSAEASPLELCVRASVDIAGSTVIMALDDSKRAYWNDLLLASALVAAGTVMSGVALMQVSSRSPVMAQATQPLQSSPPSAQDNAPAESKPGGARPTTPAPEPARPDTQAQTEGAKAALPPAPAEKMAPPINQK
jgi:hypothetical protein